MKNDDIKYFIYARKSTEGDARQILSIPAQIDDALKLQARERLKVVGTYADSGSAKTPFNRPEYSEMLKQIKKGVASGIIVWKIDRLSRNHLEGGELIHLLQTGIIKSIWTPHREYQSKDSALLISLEASMASQYSVDLSDNVTRGLDKKLSMGQPPIIAPPGYSNTKRAESGSNEIVVDKKRWASMRMAFDLILAHRYPIGKVASILNNEHQFRTRSSKQRAGSPISKSMLHRALTNPFYTGYFKYRGVLYKGVYKPMITLEEFDIVQEILGRKTRPMPHKHEFAFTGFIACGCCGCAVTASKKLKKIKTTGEYKTYTFYHCTKRKGSAVCADKRYTTEKEMREMIVDELRKLTLAPLWKQWAFETIKEDYDEELTKQNDLLKATLDYRNKILLEQDRLLDLRIGGQLTDDQYNQKKAQREALLIRVEEKYRRLETGINDWVAQIKEKLDFAESVVEKFNSDDQMLQKSICNDIGWNWTLKENKLAFTRHEWFTDLENLKNQFDSEKATLEPVKTFIEFRQTPVFEAIRPILSSLRDSIRTHRQRQD